MEDTDGIPTPQTPAPYRGQGDIALAPISITQPEGASFTVNGWEINWERWKFRVGMCQREGLVIHDVRFLDRDSTGGKITSAIPTA